MNDEQGRTSSAFEDWVSPIGQPTFRTNAQNSVATLIAANAKARRNAPHAQSICAVCRCGISTLTSLANHLRKGKAAKCSQN
jgi:hypothetical protein